MGQKHAVYKLNLITDIEGTNVYIKLGENSTLVKVILGRNDMTEILSDIKLYDEGYLVYRSHTTRLDDTIHIKAVVEGDCEFDIYYT